VGGFRSRRSPCRKNRQKVWYDFLNRPKTNFQAPVSVPSRMTNSQMIPTNIAILGIIGDVVIIESLRA
jgi:hypothetical protein